MSSTKKLHVEVWSDIVCPFCYIGKRNYEKALADFNQSAEVELEFKSFQLDPDFIQDATNKYNLTEALAKKYQRSIEEIKVMQQQITETAKSVGLDFNFDASIRFNTYNAHRIIHIAKEKGIGNQLIEALFSAYFTKGKNLGDSATLNEIAINIGLTAEDVQQALTNDSYAYKVKQDIQEAANIGISGVPFFVFNRKYGVSGAQPPQVFLETLQKSYQEWQQIEALKIVSNGAACDISGNCD